ncbi:V-type ATP synthase subunit E [Peptoniphilus sp. oral taxon 386]|uniref:V-type ATP synthase subunit E n=1 Tax=Peptoniphilus sp. oral taxon 386 TaxID=652713 RepID=UPI0001DAA058|nr:V-type ATP synthase subunit E [Peptoniphilus sp. oral taxon 386]EFI41635.1 putative ATP synthase, subunit E [Peptoniphilus sp. oral taxon 386 str. F0131]
MSNLDNLINKIETDSVKKSEEILSQANQKASEIISENEERAKTEAKKIIDRANKDSEKILDKAISGAELKARDMVLEAEQKIVDRVFETVIDRLENLSDEEYITYVKNSIANVKLTSNSVLIVPERYKQAVKNADFGIEISDESVKSGFALLMGNILYNNKFEDIVEVKKSDFEMEVFEKLFIS